MRCKTSAGRSGHDLSTGGQEVNMKLLSKRPMLFVWATTVALFLAHVHHAGPVRGFHEW